MLTEEEKKLALKKQQELDEANRLKRLQQQSDFKQALPKKPADDLVKKIVHADTKALDLITKAYKEKFLEKDKYKEGYSEPEFDKDGKLTLSFPTEEAAMTFFEEQAKAGHAFIVVDKKNNVLCYSDGHGTLNKNEAKISMEDVMAELQGHGSKACMKN